VHAADTSPACRKSVLKVVPASSSWCCFFFRRRGAWPGVVLGGGRSGRRGGVACGSHKELRYIRRRARSLLLRRRQAVQVSHCVQSGTPTQAKFQRYHYAFPFPFSYRFHSRRTFDLRELKTLLIKYNTTENHYQICLRCLPLTAGAQEGSGGERGGGGGTGDAPKPKSGRKDYIATFLHLPTLANATSAHLPDKEPLVQEWKLKRITDQCQLQLDGHERTYKLTNHFGYGYASKYSGPLDTSEVSIPFRVAPFP